ncbi:phosphopantothenoylcysteine decarboxylase isoform X1 [Tetranychus urticae]|uniref:phosphopantothenoylcysteine decarboxylase isoform X1 n=1 Tax=Tetranychus urticae TaxID=32264 RepID=UPI00077BC5F5|nr:phosphopantothenoylcysteine decarboxylase isoform X1 [Tetranychus urticae]
MIELPNSPESTNLLIGVTGSVAAIKIPILLEKLMNLPLNIVIVGTNHSFHFFDLQEIKEKYKTVKIFTDDQEWSSWKQMSDPVLHIELRKWADIMLISPLDANTLAKISSGICDNLLTCIARAWDLQKPLLFCPSMNTFMWEHPVTSEAIRKLETWGYTLIPVVSKKLACGDIGPGAMAEVDTIIAQIKSLV